MDLGTTSEFNHPRLPDPRGWVREIGTSIRRIVNQVSGCFLHWTVSMFQPIIACEPAVGQPSDNPLYSARADYPLWAQ